MGRRGLVGLLLLAMVGAGVNLLASADLSADSSWVVLQLIAAVFGAMLMVMGMVMVLLRSMREESLDDRPAPLLLSVMVIAVGLFILHNLIDFSLFDTGPMMLFMLVAGASLGARLSGRPVGRMSSRSASLLSGAVVGGWAMCIVAVVPIIRAEGIAADADEAVRGSARSGGKLDEAISGYTRAADLVGYNADYAFRAAATMIRRGAPAGDIRRMLDRATAANLYMSKAWVLRAQFESNQKSPDHAALRRAWERVLALDPKNLWARMEYAGALERGGDAAGARVQYRETLRLDDLLPKDEPKRLSAEKRRMVEAKARAGKPAPQNR
jgi:hypothetical protein